MATSKPLKRTIRLRWLPSALAFLAVGSLAGCSSQHRSAQNTAEACAQLSKALTDQKVAFLSRVRYIRNQDLLVLDYDRQMIAALNERRAAIEATSLTELSVSDEVSGCSGETLGELQREAHEEMTSLQSFLNTFNRAVKVDPPGQYIDRH